MKSAKVAYPTLIVFSCLCLLLGGMGNVHALTAKSRFDATKLADMSDFDPNNPVIPTGDTIKIACVTSSYPKQARK